jgi:hypothetical protein
VIRTEKPTFTFDQSPKEDEIVIKLNQINEVFTRRKLKNLEEINESDSPPS